MIKNLNELISKYFNTEDLSDYYPIDYKVNATIFSGNDLQELPLFPFESKDIKGVSSNNAAAVRMAFGYTQTYSWVDNEKKFIFDFSQSLAAGLKALITSVGPLSKRKVRILKNQDNGFLIHTENTAAVEYRIFVEKVED